jgi:hypothetical protein
LISCYLWYSSHRAEEAVSKVILQVFRGWPGSCRKVKSAVSHAHKTLFANPRTSLSWPNPAFGPNVSTLFMLNPRAKCPKTQLFLQGFSFFDHLANFTN